MDRMNMELEEEDDYDGLLAERVAISLDVKLAFNRLSSLIHTLKDDIGQEAANHQLQRICNDIAKVLKIRKSRGFFKEEIEIKKKDEIEFVEFHPIGEHHPSDTTTPKNNGTQNFPSQTKDCAVTILHPLNNRTSVLNSNNNGFCTSFSSSFRPISNNNLENPVELGAINEKNWLELNESAEESDSEDEDIEKGERIKMRNTSLNKKKVDAIVKKKSISPKKVDAIIKKKSISPKKNHKSKKPIKDPTPKSQASSSTKSQSSSKVATKITDDKSKNDSKKSKCAMDSKKSEELGLEKKRTKKKSENVLDREEDGPFSGMPEDDTSFILPMPSVTTDDLLESVEKNVITGRYTPPTSVFDNIYGNKSLNNSSVSSSCDDIGVKYAKFPS